MKQDMILILDLGSTSNAALARQVRSLGVYSEIRPHDTTMDELKAMNNVKGIILNGGENRVVDGEAVQIHDELYGCGIPLVSIDYPQSKCEKTFEKSISDDELKSFVFDTCHAEANWNMKNFIDDQVELIRKQV